VDGVRGDRTTVRALVLATAASVLLAGCASDDGIGAVQPDEITSSPVVPVQAAADLADPEGSVLGTVEFTDQSNGVQVDVEVHGMTTGAHPVRLVDVGQCQPPAGSAQIGELPPNQVTGTGVGSLGTLVGSVDLADLLAGDGTALVVETAADTVASGAPGSRTACRVIER
jgi:Cu/Zn superoxide dismutase